MGHKYTKEALLAGALDAALEDGLSQLTFGRLAKRLGISDRILVYYFPTIADLVSQVIVAMGLRLQEAIAPAFSAPAADHLEMVRRAWPVVATPDHSRVFALFFEANGLAVVGREPYASLVPTLVTGWIDWAAEFIAGTAAERRTQAGAAIAIIDGLVLLRLLAGSDAADQAASAISAG